MLPGGPRLPFVGDHQQRTEPADSLAERGDLPRHRIGAADDPDVVEQVLERHLRIRHRRVDLQHVEAAQLRQQAQEESR